MEIAYGPPLAQFTKRHADGVIPQLVVDEAFAAAMIAAQGYEGDVTKYKVALNLPAANADVISAANSIGLPVEEGMSPAQLVASTDALRNQLIQGGFDSYMDVAQFESEEILQIVPFYVTRVEDLTPAAEPAEGG